VVFGSGIWKTYPVQYAADVDDSRAERIVAKLKVWGQGLFNAVFRDRAAERLFNTFQDAAGEGRQITIAASQPEILRLPWELLCDPTGTYLVHENPRIAVRRQLAGAGGGRKPVGVKPKSQLRLLMVVSRPDGVGFLDPRSEAQAVLQAIEQTAPGLVVVEFLRPATLTKLVERLEHRKLPAIDKNPDEARECRYLARTTKAAFAGTQSELQQHTEFIEFVVAAMGDEAAREQLEPELVQMEENGWGQLVAAIRRVLAGEREVDVLWDDLDADDSMIIAAILRGCDGTHPVASRHPSSEGIFAGEWWRGFRTFCGFRNPTSSEKSGFLGFLSCQMAEVDLKAYHWRSIENVKLKLDSIFPDDIMSTIETIVRELEQIPEPMQLSVLDFIRSLSSNNTATTQSEAGVENHHSEKRRTTSTLIAGKGRTLGDIVSPIVDEQDWECLK
jgi:hypothetical protein